MKRHTLTAPMAAIGLLFAGLLPAAPVLTGEAPAAPSSVSAPGNTAPDTHGKAAQGESGNQEAATQPGAADADDQSGGWNYFTEERSNDAS